MVIQFDRVVRRRWIARAVEGQDGWQQRASSLQRKKLTAHRTAKQKASVTEIRRTTIGQPPEERLIAVVQGVEFQDAQVVARGVDDEKHWIIPECLNDAALGLKIPGIGISADMAAYHNTEQRVNYTIVVSTSKTELRQYLSSTHTKNKFPFDVIYRDGVDRWNILVVYSGHARYGRGPCFGPTSSYRHGNHWGTSTNPSMEGIFRMGYPYLMCWLPKSSSISIKRWLRGRRREIPTSPRCGPLR